MPTALRFHSSEQTYFIGGYHLFDWAGLLSGRGTYCLSLPPWTAAQRHLCECLLSERMSESVWVLTRPTFHGDAEAPMQID